MDIVILCMNQIKKLPTFIDGFYLEKLFDANETKDYCSDRFILCNSIKGSLYSIHSEKSYYNGDIIAGTCDIIDTMENNSRDSYIIVDEKDLAFLKNNLEYTFSSVSLLQGKKRKFKQMVQYFIECSETLSCLILFRQGLESPEKIVGPINISTFFKMIKSNKVYTNVEYIITK